MAMKLIEGQAYFPEVKRVTSQDGKYSETFPELGAVKDDGTENGKVPYWGSLDRDIKNFDFEFFYKS